VDTCNQQIYSLRETVQTIIQDRTALLRIYLWNMLKLVFWYVLQIQNALHYSYSNGPLECLNNHIKVLKRNAYGFRNFYNFKLRI
ncbi:transposase, partial [Enterococcus faecium]|uniref:transposase n=1 Tax=Enterococcus faecium TaxID=1352 RepID=UPI00292FA169